MTRAEMLAAVIDHRDRLKKQSDNEESRRLLAQLDALERRLIDGDVPTEDWEQFELHFQAYLADLMRQIRRQSAHFMLAFEDMELENPRVFDGDEEVQGLLRWWREEGGREQFLGGIPLEERRELEKKAQEWRQKREGGAPPAPPAG